MEKTNGTLANCRLFCQIHGENGHDGQARSITGWDIRAGDAFDRDGTMAGFVNKVILIGNLGADPEIRHTQDGRPIAHLRLATNETWKDRATGERRERTEWHRVVIFNEGLVRVVEQYLRKGAKVYVEGQLRTRKWTGQDGVERYTTEVVLQGYNAMLTMLDSRAGAAQSRPYDAAAASAAAMSGGMAEEMAPAFGPVPETGTPPLAGGIGNGMQQDGGMGTGAETPDFARELDDEVPF